MHILMTADTVGGVWTYTHELVTGLLRRGHRVTLVSFGGHPTPEQTQWINGLESLAYFPTAYRLEWMQESINDIEQSSAWLHQLIQQVEPDLLHFNQYAYGALPTRIPKIVVAHSDVVSWWVNTREEAPPETSWLRWYRGLVSNGLSGAHSVIAPSEWMLNALKTYYISPAESQVIHNGRDAALFDQSAPKENCVVTVGRLWDEAKQVSLVVEHNHSVPVYVAGSVEHPESLGAGTAKSYDRGGVTWLGSQSCQQLRHLYAKAAVYAGTSRYEPFGLAPVEAALSGCALLLNDIPTFHELWGDAACYFDRNNPERLAAKIRMLIDNPGQREQFAACAMDRASTAFCSDRMLDSYERAYSSLVRQEAYA
jgi:glycogen synthase